jgi:glycine hydroxymethyltransferase
MRAIADMIAGVLVEGRDPEHVREEAKELRAGHQHIHYCFTE